MPQRRLEAYFSTPRQLRAEGIKSFLELPYNVRHRIYTLAGLVRFCPIDLNREGLRNVWHSSPQQSLCFYYCRRFHGRFYGSESVTICDCPRLPCSLLFVSRAISCEVVSILYSENKFTICQNGSWGFKPLKNMGRRALTSLRSLTIRLSDCSCIYGFSTFPQRQIPPCHTLCETQGLHDRPIDGKKMQDKALLQAWHNIIAHSLAPYLSPGFVSLSVIGDCKNSDTARQVIVPLSQLPLLKSCSIRLGQNTNWELYNLAKRQTDRLTSPPGFIRKSSHFHLPEEITEKILSYTDLVAPFDLEWMPSKGFVPFDCCKKCTDTMYSCCCPSHHAAYSSTCTCWRLPIAILLTNRTLYRIATALFFSRNRFVFFLGDGVTDRWNAYQIPKLQMSPLRQFIEALPRYSCLHIRHITLTFSDFMLQSFLQDERKLAGLKEALKVLGLKLNLPKLTLVLDIDDESPYLTPLSSKTDLLRAYENLTQLFIVVRKVRKFFVFLEPRGYSQDYASILEKIVMGGKYDGAANGKLHETRQRCYDGYSLERSVLRPDGQKIWPPSFLLDKVQ